MFTRNCSVAKSAFFPILLLFQFNCTINTLLLCYMYLQMIYFKMMFLHSTSFNMYSCQYNIDTADLFIAVDAR